MVLAAPTLAAISNVTMYAGVPMYVALDGADADGDTLSFSASSSNSSLTTSIPQGNRSMRISVAGYGDMTFQLFEDGAPNTTARIIQLAQSGFYDGLTFHRIIENFMIQGGDPSGTGSGGSGVDFDDEYNPDLRHSTKGVLSMAKSIDDTNDSQFFITSTATPNLDFNHTVFGFLTQGESVRANIAAVDTDSNDKPLTTVTMSSVDIFIDTENGVLMLKAPTSFTGTASITVTASDGHGGTAQRTFQVTVQPTPSSSTASPYTSYDPVPYIGPVSPIQMTAGGQTTFNIPGHDANGSAIYYAGALMTQTSQLQVSTDTNTGQTTLTAGSAAVGVYNLRLRAASSTNYLTLDPTTYSTYAYYNDTQYVPVYVRPQTPTIDLLSSSDTGPSDSDNVTDLDNSAGKTLEFRVSNLTSGCKVYLYADGGTTPIGQATANGSEVTITTNGTLHLSDGTHTFRAVQVLENQTVDVGNLNTVVDLTSDSSAGLAVAVDTTTPQFTSTPPTYAGQDTPFTYDAETNEEAVGNVRYSLQTSVNGMVVDDRTGVVTWTPGAADLGTHQITLRATDLMGVSVDQTFQLTVLGLPQIQAISDQSIHEGQSVSFTVAVADTSLPLTYTLENAPQGATINAQTGELNWTTNESHGPGQYTMAVAVTNLAGGTSRQSFTVTVAEDNTAPQLMAIANHTVSEGEALSIQAAASDADLPANTLTFSLADGAPEGAQIDATTGLFTWTPSEAQGGSQYQVTVVVSDSANATASTTFTVTVQEVNNAPVFDPVYAQTVTTGEELLLSVRAIDTDVPATGSVVYSLDAGAPAGMTINSSTGELAWAVPEGFGTSSIDVVIRATEVTSGGVQGPTSTMSLRINVQTPQSELVDAVLPGIAAQPHLAGVRAFQFTLDLLDPPRGEAAGALSVVYDNRGFFGPGLGAQGGNHGVRTRQINTDRIDASDLSSGSAECLAPSEVELAADAAAPTSRSTVNATDIAMTALGEDGQADEAGPVDDSPSEDASELSATAVEA